MSSSYLPSFSANISDAFADQVRYKESRNPPPLNSLDALLEGTHSQLLRLATQCSDARDGLRTKSQELSCAVSLLLSLATLKFGLSDADAEILRAHLSPTGIFDDGSADSTISCSAEQLNGQPTAAGWEERTDAGMTYLLRTSLSKFQRGKGGSAVLHGSQAPSLTFPKNTSKLKRHIAVVLDRLLQGARLVRKDDDEGEEYGKGMVEGKE